VFGVHHHPINWRKPNLRLSTTITVCRTIYVSLLKGSLHVCATHIIINYNRYDVHVVVSCRSVNEHHHPPIPVSLSSLITRGRSRRFVFARRTVRGVKLNRRIIDVRGGNIHVTSISTFRRYCTSVQEELLSGACVYVWTTAVAIVRLFTRLIQTGFERRN